MTMKEDEQTAKLRQFLIDAAVTGKRVAIHSVTDDDDQTAQVCVGKVIKVSARTVVIETTDYETPIPIASVTKAEDLANLAPRADEAKVA